MNWNDSYTQGHTADIFSFTHMAPEWAQQLEWCGAGLWITIELADLANAIPGLQLYTAMPGPAKFSIIDQDQNSLELRHHFIRLEDTGFPLIACCGELTVSCKGAVLTRGFLGTCDLVGAFQLQAGSPKVPIGEVYKLPARLEVITPPGSCLLESGGLVVKPFSVTARITGNPRRIFPQDQAPIASDWQLVHRSTVSTTPRKSLKQRFFRS